MRLDVAQLARKRIPLAFRLDAVHLVSDQGVAIAELARNLDVHGN
jgi:transposase-like protein